MQCLAVFRQVMQDQQDGLNKGHVIGEEIPHARHCLDYMYQVRGLPAHSEPLKLICEQTLRCVADDTIEWEIPTMPRTKHITGMDTVRTCRDPSKLVKKACDAREVYINNGWTDGPLPDICERREMPW